MPPSRDIKISPNFTVGDWASLILDPAVAEVNWPIAVTILRDRIEGRFLRPAEQLIEAESDQSEGTFGFAILALDFLVIETVQGFRTGLTNHDGESRKLFRSFLASWASFVACVPSSAILEHCADQLYKQGRCALHHSGATDRIRVGRSGKMATFHQDGSIGLNRTAFHGALKREFYRYLDALLADDGADLRTNFKKKMGHICGK